MSFDGVWDDLAPVGRAQSGGYRRFAWTAVDLELREWFAAEAAERGLDVVTDRAGNQWAWWGDPDGAVASGELAWRPAAIWIRYPTAERSTGRSASCPRCSPSTGSEPAASPPPGRSALSISPTRRAPDSASPVAAPDCSPARWPRNARWLSSMLRGDSLADALQAAGREPAQLGADPEALRRVGCFVELHVEQGRGLADADRDHPVALGAGIWPHGRWRVELPGVANHAGTTALDDRRDAMLGYARLVLAARAAAAQHAAVATCGKVLVQPNGVNAIPSLVTAWLDARAPDERDVHAVVRELSMLAETEGGTLHEESWTGPTTFDAPLLDQVRDVLGDVPVLWTGAGHDAGILAAAGIPTAMIFVRNPTGVSHSPVEYAERADCLAGIEALGAVLARLAG